MTESCLPAELPTRVISKCREEKQKESILQWISSEWSQRHSWTAISTKVPYELAKGKHVLVIGGGDTGNDCVGTSVRLGAKSVTQLEMMPKPPVERAANNPWPQWPRVLKTDYGQEEAIAVFGHDPRIYQTTVTEFIADKNGNVCKAKICRPQSRKRMKRLEE